MLTTVTHEPRSAVATIPKACEYLGCGRSTLYAYFASGRLKRIQHGRSVVIRYTDLDQLLEELVQESAA